MAQLVKNPPAKQETCIHSLGQKNSLEKEMATHWSILIWEVLWTEEPGGLQSMRLPWVGHDLATKAPPSTLQIEHPSTYVHVCIYISISQILKQIICILFACTITFKVKIYFIFINIWIAFFMMEEVEVEGTNYKPLTNEYAEICLIIFLEHISEENICIILIIWFLKICSKKMIKQISAYSLVSGL